MARRCIAPSLIEHGQNRIKPGQQQGRSAKSRHLRRGELNGERQPIEPADDLCDVVHAPHIDLRVDGTCSVDKEPNRGIAPDRRGASLERLTRHMQWIDRDDHFRCDA